LKIKAFFFFFFLGVEHKSARLLTKG